MELQCVAVVFLMGYLATIRFSSNSCDAGDPELYGLKIGIELVDMGPGLKYFGCLLILDFADLVKLPGRLDGRECGLGRLPLVNI